MNVDHLGLHGHVALGEAQDCRMTTECGHTGSNKDDVFARSLAAPVETGIAPTAPDDVIIIDSSSDVLKNQFKSHVTFPIDSRVTSTSDKESSEAESSVIVGDRNICGRGRDPRGRGQLGDCCHDVVSKNLQRLQKRGRGRPRKCVASSLSHVIGSDFPSIGGAQIASDATSNRLKGDVNGQSAIHQSDEKQRFLLGCCSDNTMWLSSTAPDDTQSDASLQRQQPVASRGGVVAATCQRQPPKAGRCNKTEMHVHCRATDSEPKRRSEEQQLSQSLFINSRLEGTVTDVVRRNAASGAGIYAAASAVPRTTDSAAGTKLKISSADEFCASFPHQLDDRVTSAATGDVMERRRSQANSPDADNRKWNSGKSNRRVAAVESSGDVDTVALSPSARDTVGRVFGDDNVISMGEEDGAYDGIKSRLYTTADCRLMNAAERDAITCQMCNTETRPLETNGKDGNIDCYFDTLTVSDAIIGRPQMSSTPNDESTVSTSGGSEKAVVLPPNKPRGARLRYKPRSHPQRRDDEDDEPISRDELAKLIAGGASRTNRGVSIGDEIRQRYPCDSGPSQPTSRLLATSVPASSASSVVQSCSTSAAQLTVAKQPAKTAGSMENFVEQLSHCHHYAESTTMTAQTATHGFSASLAVCDVSSHQRHTQWHLQDVTINFQAVHTMAEPAQHVSNCHRTTSKRVSMQATDGRDGVIATKKRRHREGNVRSSPAKRCNVDKFKSKLYADYHVTREKSVSVLQVDAPCSSSCSAPNGLLVKQLLDLQNKLSTVSDAAVLQRVVQIVGKTGCYVINDATFDFDLCNLDASTIEKLADCLGSGHSFD